MHFFRSHIASAKYCYEDCMNFVQQTKLYSSATESFNPLRILAVSLYGEFIIRTAL